MDEIGDGPRMLNASPTEASLSNARTVPWTASRTSVGCEMNGRPSNPSARLGCQRQTSGPGIPGAGQVLNGDPQIVVVTLLGVLEALNLGAQAH